VLVAKGLSKGYSLGQRVLDRLDLSVPRGAVYGLLGRNGSGKTTLLKTVLGLFRPDAGELKVFGRDPWSKGPDVLRRIGYVPETLRTYEWMRVGELLEYLRPFYPSWDQSFVYHLLKRYGLPLGLRLRNLSRGQRSQVSLVAALAHRPELLLLDDPTLGLDAVVLEEFVETLQEIARNEGTTSVIASHNYEEVERIASHVGFMKSGKILLSDTLHGVKNRCREVRITFADEVPELGNLPNFKVLRTSGRRLTGVLLDASSSAMDRLRQMGAEAMEVRELSLKEIFVSFLR
jgi:ABC-2 type transport system ATP-binding protein